MKHTEDEARERWCPYARHPWEGPQGDVCAVNDSGNEWSRCIASDCMAWRKAGGEWRSPMGPEASQAARTPEDGDATYITKGYCGLAGKP